MENCIYMTSEQEIIDIIRAIKYGEYFNLVYFGPSIYTNFMEYTSDIEGHKMGIITLYNVKYDIPVYLVGSPEELFFSLNQTDENELFFITTYSRLFNKCPHCLNVCESIFA